MSADAKRVTHVQTLKQNGTFAHKPFWWIKFWNPKPKLGKSPQKMFTFDVVGKLCCVVDLVMFSQAERRDVHPFLMSQAVERGRPNAPGYD